MEADYNFLNKLIVESYMTKLAENCEKIPEKLHDSRAGLDTILVAVNRRLTIDILRQKRSSGAIIGVDAVQ